MSDWEKESFDSFINDGLFHIVQTGPLYSPVSSFSIKRNENLEIILKTLTAEGAKCPTINHPPGTVRHNTDRVELMNSSGVKVIASGVLSQQDFSADLNIESGLETVNEVSSIYSLEAIICNENVQYTIDWLANTDEQYIWPDCIKDAANEGRARAIISSEGEPVLISSDGSFPSQFPSSNTRCVKVRIDTLSVYLCLPRQNSSEKYLKSGFILYMGCPTEDEREKIRNCFSLALGKYLVYLGQTAFCKDWKMVSFKAISAYSIDGKALKSGVLPPAPIDSKMLNYINPVILSKIVNAFYINYEKLEIDRLSWLYWHAVYAPMHIAAVHFGAAIEALQSNYIESQKLTIKQLLKKPQWQDLKANLDDIILDSEIEGNVKKILTNSVGNLNNAPQNLVSERLFSALNLQTSPQETKAWKRRNDAGHGNKIKDKDHINLIRDNKLLMIRFHRMLLSMTQASDFYYDYYTVRHPIRNIADSIPAS